MKYSKETYERLFDDWHDKRMSIIYDTNNNPDKIRDKFFDFDSVAGMFKMTSAFQNNIFLYKEKWCLKMSNTNVDKYVDTRSVTIETFVNNLSTDDHEFYQDVLTKQVVRFSRIEGIAVDFNSMKFTLDKEDMLYICEFSVDCGYISADAMFARHNPIQYFDKHNISEPDFDWI